MGAMPLGSHSNPVTHISSPCFMNEKLKATRNLTAQEKVYSRKLPCRVRGPHPSWGPKATAATPPPGQLSLQHCPTALRARAHPEDTAVSSLAESASPNKSQLLFPSPFIRRNPASHSSQARSTERENHAGEAGQGEALIWIGDALSSCLLGTDEGREKVQFFREKRSGSLQ